MKYPYRVKHDGVWYEPGQEVPERVSTEKTIKEDEIPAMDVKPRQRRKKKTEA